jgi:S-adenosylmethionine:diacylglycerol 3-amino-3-carboxypropyl transferase
MFALVREDPAIERGLAVSAKKVVVVGSGGCTALSLLTDDVDDVLVVDVSPAQTALVALRVAALGALERDEYLRFVGARPADDRRATWGLLRPIVAPEVRAAWDAQLEAIEAGVDGCGVTEAFYRYVGRCLRHSEWPDELWVALLTASSMAEQRAVFAEHFSNDPFRVALDMLLSRATHELFYPPAIFAHVAEHDFARFFGRRFREFAETRPLRGNYFLSQIVFGRYVFDDPDGVPPYLAPAGYAVARRNLHKLRVATGRLEDVLEEETDVDAFFLSNVLDWASPAQADRLGVAVAGAARPGAVVLLRHMLGRPGFPASFGVEVDETASREAQRVERSFLYGAVGVGRVRSTVGAAP